MERSEVMRRVKGENTTPEKKARSLLHRLGYRFRLHRADLPGKPDIVFPARRSVIFIHGCFWHGHDCARGARMPKTNADYWRQKIARNRVRDEKHLAELEKLGWRALVVWECEMRDEKSMIGKFRSFLS
ncbi:MAG: very short patch repair endonuclease [Rhizobiales bacterium 65-9]|nr:DNA mismatch endonuclease Vsr [Hyphomicrobiales bacterium]OJY38146.1 MAG: very short patch repair endonuclease [Rhizobiales bacterium 65-9]